MNTSLLPGLQAALAGIPRHGLSWHPAVLSWWQDTFPASTVVQQRAWPVLASGDDALLVAPTGSGKTLAAFLAAIDRLVHRGLAGGLPRHTVVLYVSPLRALATDVACNLEAPLAGIAAKLEQLGFADVPIRHGVRHGDTPPAVRRAMVREPPHLLMTTPESLYLLLGSVSGRAMLAHVETVIVDELHALAGTKRGAHLALSLARLDALLPSAPQRIGLSATAAPLEDLAAFLVGCDAAAGLARGCVIVDASAKRPMDLSLLLPSHPLGAVMSQEAWDGLYDQLAQLAAAHRSTLIFTRTRRACERAARALAQRLGEEQVMAHHGSLSQAQRQQAEQRLKAGGLKVLVATASLELGIDVGAVDLVCQLGSPGAVNTMWQRAGRSGHGVGGHPKARLVPLSRNDLVECTAVLQAMAQGVLDETPATPMALDVLAQHIVAEVAARPDGIAQEALFALCRRSWPYRTLEATAFEAVVAMLCHGYGGESVQRTSWLLRHGHPAVLRARRGARLAALTGGGAIADQFDYDVCLMADGTKVGSVNEDFALESLSGDVFQLGNRAYRIRWVRGGIVWVEESSHAAASVPFWLGEAPGLSPALSQAVLQVLEGCAICLDGHGVSQGHDQALTWLATIPGVSSDAAGQLAAYLSEASEVLGALPSRHRMILERFFDDLGDQHLVIHAPLGQRINKALGLALRKRFCRRFNFELQAAASDHGVLLSLGPSHSFLLEEVMRYLAPQTVKDVLVQALLTAPMFTTRWRWNSTIALAVARRHGGKRRPAQWQRQDAENLLTQVFPMQLACAENISGEREVPNHPLVQQTITDCLKETMDLQGLVELLRGLKEGAVQLVCCDGHKPSVLAQELLVARPYAFLDDAPAEERRSRSVGAQVALPGEGIVDPKQVDNLRRQAQGMVDSAERLEEWLLDTGFVAAAEGEHQGWRDWFAALCTEGRATQAWLPEGQRLWLADQHAALVRRLHPAVRFEPPRPEAGIELPEPPLHGREDQENEAAQVALRTLSSQRLQALGLWDDEEGALADILGVAVAACRKAIAQLVADGAVLQLAAGPDGRSFWCGRQLARRCRAQAGRSGTTRMIRIPQPADAATWKRFLGAWHGLAAGRHADMQQDEAGLQAALERLAALPVPMAAWEQAILPARLPSLRQTALDALLHTGRWVWLRPEPPVPGTWRGSSLRHVPVALLSRGDLPLWLAARGGFPAPPQPSARAALVLDALERFGALFSDELQARAGGMLGYELKQALRELVALGLVRGDGWAGLRALLQASPSRHRHRHRRARMEDHLGEAGRWVALGQGAAADPAPWAGRMARILLERHGIVFHELLAHEPMSPSWRVLRGIWRTMEARGEVRMGRFVAGCSGEQYALDEAITLLQRMETQGPDGQEWLLHAADPIHATGLHHGQRPAHPGGWVRYRDGVLLEKDMPGSAPLAARQHTGASFVHARLNHG